MLANSYSMNNSNYSVHCSAMWQFAHHTCRVETACQNWMCQTAPPQCLPMSPTKRTTVTNVGPHLPAQTVSPFAFWSNNYKRVTTKFSPWIPSLWSWPISIFCCCAKSSHGIPRYANCELLSLNPQELCGEDGERTATGQHVLNMTTKYFTCTYTTMYIAFENI